MPEPYSELANWDGRLFQSPKRDQNIPSSFIGSPSRSVSYPQPVYSSSSQLTFHHNTEKLSPAQEFIDNKRADLVQNSVLSEHGLSTGMLSTPRSHKLSDVPPVSATVVAPGADNSSKPKHGISLSSLIEKAVGHKLGDRKFVFSEQQITHGKMLPSEHARNPSSPVIGAHHVDKPSNIKPLYMPHSQLPTNKDQARPSENTEHTCDAVSAREAPISAIADLSFPSNIIPAAPSGPLDEVRPVGASLIPLLPETGVTPLFLPGSPTSSSTPTPKGRGGDADEENFVNDMLTENPKPGPSGPRIASPVVQSPALTPGDSLFTPPPELPRRRPREILDYVAVPPFPEGLTRADYKLSPLGRLARSQSRPGVTVHNSVGDALTAAYTSNALLDSSASSERKGKGRERNAEEHEPPPRKKYKPHVPELFGADISTHSNGFIDLHFPPTVLHLPDLDLDFDPAPSSPQILQSNTRHVLRRISEKHSETEFISPFSPFFGPLLQRKSDMAHTSSQWVYAPPSSAQQKDKGTTARTHRPPVSPVKTGVSSRKVVRPTSVAQPEATPAASTSAESNDHSRASSTPFLDPHHIDDDLSMDVDMNMDEYFNGLGDAPSPSKRMTEDAYMPLAISRDMFVVQHRQQHHDQHAALWRFSSNPVLGDQGEGSSGFLGVPHNSKETEIQLATRTSPGYKSEFATEPGYHDPFMGTPGGSAGGVLDLDPWNLVDQDHVSPANSPVGPLGGGTIDPSLLGGGELEKPNSQPSDLMSPPRSALSPGPVIYVRRPEGLHDGSAQPLPSSSKLPGKGKRAVQIRYRPTASVQASDDEVAYVPKRNKSTPDSDYEPSVDEEDIRISRRGIKPSLKIRLSGASITHTDSKTCPIPDSDAEVAKKIERPLSITKPSKQKGSKTPKLEDNMTFCHQCRNRNTREKMVCASSRSDGRVCGKYFCIVCVLNRYPEIEFDSSLATWICPYCTNICNCSNCAPKRGEVYISARGGGFAGRRTKSHVVLVRDNEGPSKTHTPPPNAPKLWATVYGLSGERVGQAYMGDEGQPLQRLTPIASRAGPKAKARRPRKPHVFIGVPQPSWGVKSFKYLDEAADDVPDAMLQGNVRGKAADGRRVRMYIGDRSALYQPFKRMSDLDPPSRSRSPSPSRSSSPSLSDSDGTLTPLSELEATYWPQPDVGESCHWEPPPPESTEAGVRGLSQEQVVRAIHDALAAVV